MNTLCIILIIVAILIAVPLIAAAFFSTKYDIPCEIVIDKPRREVFDYIKMLKNQDNYSKWVMMDPNMKKTFTGIDGTVGFIYAWDSENKQAGQGEQEIVKLKDGERIENEVRFIKPFAGKALTVMITESISGNQTRVKWIFYGQRTYILKLMYLLLNLKKVLRKDINTSLGNLKRILETGN